MIPQAFITEWRREAPWPSDAQVEQDLVISRALVEIFSDPVLKDNLGFRGGTAMHKLYLNPAVRYSEDVDLIQIHPGPVGHLFDRLKTCLSFLDEPVRKQKNRNNVLLFRFQSTMAPVTPLRLKVEINCREHFAIHGIQNVPFQVNSLWFNGKADLSTFTLEELLGSKMRALYQRKQGRDLFDLWHAVTNCKLDAGQVIDCFYHFMEASEVSVSRSEYEENLTLKMKDRIFNADIRALLRPDFKYDPNIAFDVVMDIFVSRLD